jgi:exopolyphosphatase/guanosine-5'-triphosphate,3'-diphosphate pyrophosphatase
LSLKTYKYAAIDAGSNAVRLLLSEVNEENGVFHFNRYEFVRIPLRLGLDVYQTGKISATKERQFIKTMQAFKLLIEVYNPISMRACATASLREAINGNDLVSKVKSNAKLKLEIISGKEEAEIIYSNHTEQLLEKNQSYLYIDVGGGSTEVTLFDNGQRIFSQSFNIGTLRWLKGKVTKDYWDEVKQIVAKLTLGHFPLTAIGSGGNINKVFRLLEKKDKPLSFQRMKDLYAEMKIHSIEERMEIWDLATDRADVIVPAMKIYLGIMNAARIDNIVVPQIGLADGIVHQLHENYIGK